MILKWNGKNFQKNDALPFNYPPFWRNNVLLTETTPTNGYPGSAGFVTDNRDKNCL